MAIYDHDAESEADRNVRTRRASDLLLSRLVGVHGDVRKSVKVAARRQQDERSYRQRDNDANQRNTAPPPDFHLMNAVALLGG